MIGGTTQFLYDGANPVQEISGTTASANLLTGGVDEYFQRTDAAGARNFLTDALGSTLALADSTGTLQTQYTFEPFGNTQVTGTTTTNSFAYTSRELDATGLYFYRARYYHPTLQRFVSEDPLRFRGNSVNFYELSYDNPTNLVDPFGLQPIGIDLLTSFLRQSPCTQARIFQGVKGLGNIGVGVVKVAAGVAFTEGTGGLANGFGSYFIVNGFVASMGGGIAQITAAITGDVEAGDTVEENMAGIGSVFGVGGLIRTRGDFHTAAQWSRFEPFDAALGLMTAGAEVGVNELLDIGINSEELIEGAVNKRNPCKDEAAKRNLAHRK